MLLDLCTFFKESSSSTLPVRGHGLCSSFSVFSTSFHSVHWLLSCKTTSSVLHSVSYGAVCIILYLPRPSPLFVRVAWIDSGPAPVTWTCACFLNSTLNSRLISIHRSSFSRSRWYQMSCMAFKVLETVLKGPFNIGWPRLKWLLGITVKFRKQLF